MIKYNGKVIDNIEAKYLIISSVSFSTTPSRALDILIASNSFTRIGFLQSKCIQPAVGYLNKNIEGGTLGLSGELYKKDQVIIIQLRSNIRLGRKKQFVEQIAKILQTNLKTDSMLIVGSLPFSLRPDLEIQSMSRNTYFYSKHNNPDMKKLEQNNLIKSLELLIHEDEEITDILEAGFIKHIIKSDKFPKVDYLCVFSEKLIDHEAALKLAKSISVVSDRKQLGKIEQHILDD